MRAPMILGSILILALPSMPALSGCGGDTSSGSSTSSGSGGGGAITAEAACNGFAVSLCERVASCAPFSLQIAYGDQGKCEGAAIPRCIALSELPGSSFDPKTIQACADDYHALSCDNVLVGDVPASCRPTGDKDDGAVCAAGPECKGGVCRLQGEGQCGACATPIADGEACDPSSTVCKAGSFCAASGKCQKGGTKSAACDDTNPCTVGLSCNSGTCGDPLGPGADCSGGGQCDAANGLYCEAKSNTCALLGIAKVGEVCGIDDQSGLITLCEGDGECDFDAKKCIARLGEGDSCVVDIQSGTSHCGLGLECVEGKCSRGYPSCQ